MRFLLKRLLLAAAAFAGVLYGTRCRAEEGQSDAAATLPTALLEEILRAAFAPSPDARPLQLAALADEADDDEPGLEGRRGLRSAGRASPARRPPRGPWPRP
jgi:hypothetical protein